MSLKPERDFFFHISDQIKFDLVFHLKTSSAQWDVPEDKGSGVTCGRGKGGREGAVWMGWGRAGRLGGCCRDGLGSAQYSKSAPPLPVPLLGAAVSRGAAVLMEADEAVNRQTAGEDRGMGGAARRSGGAGRRGGLP